MSINEVFDNALDRYRKLRVGQLISDVDSNGFVAVVWMDGDIGGQSAIQLSYPAFKPFTPGKPAGLPIPPSLTPTPAVSSTPAWGMEMGYGKGMVCVFGFLTDNHAVILTTLVSRSTGENAGYKKTQKIKSGEFRITSKAQGSIYFDAQGNVIIANPENSIVLNNAGKKIDIVSSGVKIHIGAVDQGQQGLDNEPPKASVDIEVDGSIELKANGHSIQFSKTGINITAKSPEHVSIGSDGVNPFFALYSLTGANPTKFEEIAVCNTLTVSGETIEVPPDED